MCYPVLPYWLISPTFIEEYAGGLLTDLEKQDGGLRPILYAEIWRRCFTSLAVSATSVRNEEAKFFTSTYNFIQTTGIWDGFYDNLDTTSDPNDPEVIIIKI